VEESSVNQQPSFVLPSTSDFRNSDV